MAAVLKKRVAAEFTHVLQQGEVTAPPVKRLKLKLSLPQELSSPAVNLSKDLNKCTSTRESFKVLLELEESLPLAPSQVQSTVNTLLERLRIEKEPAVRAKMATVLGSLCRAPSCDVVMLAEDIENLLSQEKSSVALSGLVQVLVTIGQTQRQNENLRKSILSVACMFLNSNSHLVRCKCLNVIGELGSHDTDLSSVIGVKKSGYRSAAQLLCTFTEDCDGRVRAHAFQALLLWHSRGIRLDQSVYDSACSALNDDHEGVRLAAVKLLWVLTQLYPNSMVPVSGCKIETDTMRLMDDGFAKICNAVNDISVKVRAEAARLLGSLHDVSAEFLEQTLDKKLMSNMRRKRTAHERQKDLYERGEWSSGNKFGDDAPKEEIDPDNVSLMSSGACGAFVHGLEDEYLEVRNASIDSLCELATSSSHFATLCQDFLVDMFNDEIESVRLNAIHSLRKISHHFHLREDQLEIILSVLKDFNMEIREALRDMLSHCRLATRECVNVLVFTLLENLKRYPEDKRSIWKCMKNVGRHHSSMVLSMVPEFLCIHPYLESIEPDVEDPAYVSVLALVFNAAVDSPTMTSLFPGYIEFHYRSLRDAMPDIIPALKLGKGGKSEKVEVAEGKIFSSSGSSTGDGSGRGFLKETLARLDNIHMLDSNSATQLLQISIRDLQRVKEIEINSGATAECVALYLKAQLVLHKALGISSAACSVIGSARERDHLSALITKILELIKRLIHLYVGLDTSALVQIGQLNLRTCALRLLVSLQDNSSTNRKAASRQLLHVLAQHDRLLKKSGSKPDLCTRSLLDETESIKSCDSSAVGLKQSLLLALRQNSFSLLQLSNQLRKTEAVIIEPSGTQDATVKFAAGLTTSISLDANLSNVCRTCCIRVRVCYPDQQVHLITPQPTDLHRLGDLDIHLVTKVILSHSVWSEPGTVELSVVLLCDCDQCAPSSNSSTQTSAYEELALCQERRGLIQISKPVCISIAPIAAHRS